MAHNKYLIPWLKEDTDPFSAKSAAQMLCLSVT